MFIVGLTGGIGSGKSSAARLFAELGAGVIDTDAIAHHLTQGGGAALPAIRRQFGDAYFAADASLNRAQLRQLVFSDAAARRQLEAILHPLIRSQVGAQIAAMTGFPYLILVVPLLLETGGYRDLVRRILVVDCPQAAQIERTVARSKLAAAEVRAITAAQLPRAERLAQADDVIANDGGLAKLRRQVTALHRYYLDLARQADPNPA